MSESTYTIKNTLVKGKGHSYNLNNRYDAQKLCQTLNQYENNCKNNTDYQKLKQLIIALQMDIKTLQADLDQIKELMK